MIEKGDEGFELQPRNVRPAATAFEGLKKAKQLLTVFRKTVAKRSFLNVAMERLKLSEEEEQSFRLIAMVVGEHPQLLQQGLKLSLNHGVIVALHADRFTLLRGCEPSWSGRSTSVGSASSVDIVTTRPLGNSLMRFRPLLAIVLALCLSVVTACSGGAQAVDRSNVTYDDIRNTGKANDCPTLSDSARGSISLTPGDAYELRGICMHPTQVFIKGEPANKRQEAQFVEGKILTRYTSSLDEVYGTLTVGEDSISFKEEGGIDFQPITVLVPGGEEFPFTFSSKNLDATANGAAITTSTDFQGTYRTPSYRTSNFIDPKGRALTTGVDYPQGLIGLGGDYKELETENVKRYIDGQGVMSMSITKVDPETGEFAGVFSAIQPSDSDMGGREIVDVKINGELFGRLEEA